MKHTLKLLACVSLLFNLQFSIFNSLVAQTTRNDKADNIVGTYACEQNGDKFRVKITKQSDGTYQGQIIWVEKDKDANGKKLLDTKNPDKKLRNTPCDRIVLFSGLEYNAKKKHWDGTKIYDPQRGIRAKLTINFENDGRLGVRGSLLGIGETVYWTPLTQ